LQPGDQVLVAESCTHHPVEEDIGRVKIPRWLRQYVGGELQLTTVKGRDFPADLSPYKLVIHCGACMWNRQEMLNRIRECHRQGVPITNYGLVIAYALGILERALEPFPEALCENRPSRLRELYERADSVRREHVGDAVHLRGLIEISSHCVRQCMYCGLRLANYELPRYRMTREEILNCALQAERLGYGTVVMQAGEDDLLTAEWI